MVGPLVEELFLRLPLGTGEEIIPEIEAGEETSIHLRGIERQDKMANRQEELMKREKVESNHMHKRPFNSVNIIY